MNFRLTTRFSIIFSISILLPISAFAQSVFEGTQDGISRSGLPIYGGGVVDIAIGSNGNLYAGLGSPSGIFCSTDAAVTWSGPPSGSDFGSIANVEVGETANTIYMIGGINIYKSSDACATWTELQGSIEENDFGTAMKYAHDVLLVARRDGTIDKSTDGGETFTNVTVNAGATGLTDIAASPTDDVFFALATIGSDQTLYKSTDAGDTWSTVGKSGNFSKVGIDPNNANFIIVAGNDDVDYSTDGGTSFSDGLAGSSNTSISFVTVSGTDRAFVGPNYTTDDGSNWTDINNTASSTDTDLGGVVVADPDNSSQFFMVSGRGIAKSTDSQDTWTDSVTNMFGVNVTGIQQTTDKNTIYLACTGGIAKTSNYLDGDSATWTFPIDPTDMGVAAMDVLLPDKSDPDTVIASAFGKIYKSTNGGTTWTETDTTGVLQNRDEVNTFAVNSDGDLFAGFNNTDDGDGGVLTSTDNGDSWSETNIPNDPTINKLISVGNVIYAAVGSENNDASNVRGIYKLDSGTWTQLSGDIDGERIRDIAASSTSLIAVGGEVTQGTGGVFRSNDDGETWTEISTGITETRCMKSIAIDPDNESTLFAAFGCPAGTMVLYTSADNGDNWSTYYTGLKDEEPGVMLFDDLIAGFNTGVYEFGAGTSIASPQYIFWNGYLSQTNILELINSGDTNRIVTVTLYDASGEELSATQFQVNASSQVDIILNGVSGFSENQYGVAKLTYEGTDIFGRLSNYKAASNATGGDNWAFVYSLPIENSITGTSSVGFNTNQPSQNISEASDQVFNWLSIANLDSSQAKVFEIERYDSSGNELSSVTVAVPALGRLDVDGGHGEEVSIGWLKIIPSDSSAAYKAILTRYGSTAASGEVVSDYAFAIPFSAQASTTAEQWLPISRGSGSINWIEITNISSSTTTATVTFYDNAGEEILGTLESIELEAGEQIHLNASSVLSIGQSGAALVSTTNANTTIANSVSYYLDSSSSIAASHASQGAGSTSDTIKGSWNLFLGMYNWLRLFNTGSTTQSYTVVVNNGSESETLNVSLGAKEGTDLGLHEVGTYGTAVDSYGFFSVSGSNLRASMLRVKPTDVGGLDFVSDLKVR